jgi:hypothetical protein
MLLLRYAAYPSHRPSNRENPSKSQCANGTDGVTDNQVDFRDIPGLSMENWVVKT